MYEICEVQARRTRVKISYDERRDRAELPRHLDEKENERDLEREWDWLAFSLCLPVLGTKSRRGAQRRRAKLEGFYSHLGNGYLHTSITLHAVWVVSDKCVGGYASRDHFGRRSSVDHAPGLDDIEAETGRWKITS